MITITSPHILPLQHPSGTRQMLRATALWYLRALSGDHTGAPVSWALAFRRCRPNLPVGPETSSQPLVLLSFSRNTCFHCGLAGPQRSRCNKTVNRQKLLGTRDKLPGLGMYSPAPGLVLQWSSPCEGPQTLEQTIHYSVQPTSCTSKSGRPDDKFWLRPF